MKLFVTCSQCGESSESEEIKIGECGFTQIMLKCGHVAYFTIERDVEGELRMNKGLDSEAHYWGSSEGKE